MAVLPPLLRDRTDDVSPHGIATMSTRWCSVTFKRFAGGVALHDGQTTVRFSKGLYVVPIRALWSRL